MDPNELQVVLGDLAECGASKWQSAGEIAGLVVRRQTALFTAWRPWIALLGLLVPFGIALSWQSRLTSGSSATTLWLYFNNWDWALLNMPAFRHDFPLFLVGVFSQLLTLASWAWGSWLRNWFDIA